MEVQTHPLLRALDRALSACRHVFTHLDRRKGSDGITEPTLSDEQLAIYEALEHTRAHAFITGKAGTGKSVLLRYFARHTQKAVLKVAPTGIAALNIGGQTIHSLFKLPVGLIHPGAITVSTELRETLQHVDTIIIDEISMVRADTIDAIDRILRISKQDQTPFGNTQLVMVGDVYQLPPVVMGAELQHYFTARYGGAYFFNAHVWKKAELLTYELQTVFRQADTDFRDLLNAIRDGSYTKDHLHGLAARVVAARNVPADAVALTSTNKAAQLINEARLASLRGKRRTYSATLTGELPSSALPTDEKLTLCIGAQIVFVRNDPDGKWVNGTTGIITALKQDHIRIRCGQTTHDVAPTIWEQSSYIYDEEIGAIRQEAAGTFTQYPIKLAWAITIHKSQGCTYDKVAVDLRRGAFAHGQTYVALSRCRSIDGLYLLGDVKPRDIIIDPVVAKFMQQTQTPEAA